MQAAKFEWLATRHGFKPLDAVQGKQGDILIAERYFDHSDMEFSPALREEVFEFLVPHWCTFWALSREQLDVGQYVYHGKDTPQATRIKIAVEAAQDWIKVNLEGQRFK